ncbi:FAD-dependent oxidoreductase [Streptomyces sp. NPDC047061]|uniref:FAD-dependent oxidoreductase n=1 Tax=Streptomyces sp. NPDC047061 TaxID=3154605 RepID=UPI003407C8B1
MSRLPSSDFERLVVATGMTRRTLPGTREPAGVHTLCTVDDARVLRAELDHGPRAVVVVGAGLIGAEFAAAARARRLDGCVVEAQATPMAHLFGEAAEVELVGTAWAPRAAYAPRTFLSGGRLPGQGLPAARACGCRRAVRRERIFP